MTNGTDRHSLGKVTQTTSDGAVCRLDRVALEESRSIGDFSRNMTSIGGLCKIAVDDMLVVGSLTELWESPDNAKQATHAHTKTPCIDT